MKRIIILLIALVPAFCTFAQKETGTRERTKNWLQREDTSGGLRGGGIGDDEEPGGGLSVPVGMFPLAGMLLLGGLYMVSRNKKRLFRLGTLAVLLLLPLGLNAQSWPDEGINWPAGQILPSFATSAQVQDCYLDLNGKPREDHYLLSSLKGLVNAKKPRIFTYDGDGGAEGALAWIHSLQYDYKIYNNYWDLLLKYKDEVNKYIIYNPSYPYSVNIATTYAKKYQAVIASPAYAAILAAPPYNFTCAWDLNTLATSSYSTDAQAATYVYNNYWNSVDNDKRIVMGLSPEFHAGGGREYAVALGLTTFWLPASSTTVNNIFNSMPAHGVYMGWWPDESAGIKKASNYTIPVIASDYSTNLPFHSGTSRVINPRPIPPCPPLENKVYVAFVVSDGDNFQCVEHMMRILWSNGDRGKAPISWTVSPAMVDGMPGALNYYHRTATDNDCLIVGPSGYAYMNPDQWGSSRNNLTLANFVAKTDEYCQAAGLRSITVWTSSGALSATAYNAYAANAPSLLGIVDHNSGNSVLYSYGIGGNVRTNGGYSLPVMRIRMNYGSTKQQLIDNISNSNVTPSGTVTAPRFVILQVNPWEGDRCSPTMFKEAADYFKSTGKHVFVRLDHLLMLYRQSQSITTTPGVPAVGAGNGLQGAYFNGRNFDSSVGNRVDNTVNYNWNSAAPYGSGDANNFTIRWTGQVQTRHSGHYTFYVTGNGGIRLWVNDQLIIDQWDGGVRGATTNQGTVFGLNASTKYNIKLEYLKNSELPVCDGVNGNSCKLEWSNGAFLQREVIPQTQLFTP